MVYALDGNSWVKNSTLRSSRGATHHDVLKAPPQPYSPTLVSTLPACGSVTTDTPRPNPTPSKVVSEKSGRPNSSRSTPPGRWLVVMYDTVRGDSSRTPSSSPPCRSISENRR